jgi:3'(2'), 5'-bisphosphate nucleotidase
VLLAALKTCAPLVPVIAEESMAAGIQPDVTGTFFLVDPLDGTREFIAGRGEFTINIALIENGRPGFGLIFAPASGRLFVTVSPTESVEAIIDPTNGPERLDDMKTQPMRTRIAPAEGMVAIASRSHMTDATASFLKRFPIMDSRSAGSSMKFCLVARGDADIYPRINGKTCEWDIAAGHAILKAAGGDVTEPDGTPLRYAKVADRYVNGDFVAWGRMETRNRASA